MRLATGMAIAVLRGAQENNVNFVLSLSFKLVKRINMDILDNRFHGAFAAHEPAHSFFCRWGSRMDLMTRKLFCVFLILLLISGCAMTADPESETQETKTASTTLSEKQADITKPATPAEFRWDQGNQSDPLANKTVNSANKIPSKDEIRLLQVRMKAAGFDPGLPDGVIGPKTEKALHRFQLACTALNYLIGTAEMETVWKTADAQATKLNGTTNQNSNQDEIRLLQTRMKAVGLDPGPIDGIMGAKTRSQLVAAHLVCSMLKTFPAILNQEPQLPEKRVPALVGPQKPVQPVTSPSTASVTAVNKNPSQQSISRKPWLAPMTSN
jgi:peptidoglycan hydrolase-like protein with peptidoglycan-binding domain